MAHRILHLSSREIERLHLGPEDLRQTIAEALRACTPDEADIGGKSKIQVDDQRFFMSMYHATPSLGYGVTKWVGFAESNRARGMETINALVILNDIDTGLPVAIMDGTWITTHRTAALSALAAKYLARPESRALGFIGCGVQAHSHLSALRAVLPDLTGIHAVSRSPASAEALAEAARAEGLAATVSDSPEDVVRASDVIVSGLPGISGIEPVARADWLRPGALVLGVDLGRTWARGGLREAFDLMVTDSRAMVEKNGGGAALAYPGPYDADLTDLVTSAHPGRSHAEETIMFLYPGMAIADLAVAAHIYKSACAASIGTWLAR